MINRQLALGMIHGTGAINAVFGGAMVVELDKGGVK